MRVGDVCNHHAVIIGKSDSVYTAAVLMRDHHANYVVVVESRGGYNIPVGALTDRDIVVKIAANDIDMKVITVADVMDAPIIADEKDSIMATLKRMRHNRVRYIPVINTCKALIGVLSVEDILESLTEQLSDIGYIIIRDKISLHEEAY